MEDIYKNILLLFVGIISGFMNTVASSGSAVTLPTMIFMGIAPGVANATNRLPILIGFIIAVYNFHKAKAILWKRALLMAIPVAIGTAAGALYVISLSADKINLILAVALGVSLGLLILNPRKFIAKRTGDGNKITMLSYFIMLGIGLWAGIIVLDTATFLLFTLVFNQGLDIIKANAVKSVLALTIGLISTLVFAIHGSIDIHAGLFLSIGSVAGSHWGSKFAIQENSRKWIYRIIMIIIIIEILKLNLNNFI